MTCPQLPFNLLAQFSSLILIQIVFVLNERHLLLPRLPAFHPSDLAWRMRLPSRDPTDWHRIPSWKVLRSLNMLASTHQLLLTLEYSELWCPQQVAVQLVFHPLPIESLGVNLCTSCVRPFFLAPSWRTRLCCGSVSWIYSDFPRAHCESPNISRRQFRCQSSCSWRRSENYPRFGRRPLKKVERFG